MRLCQITIFLANMAFIFAFTQPRLKFSAIKTLRKASSVIMNAESLTSPPTSFLNCVKQSVAACKNVLANKDVLMEVEFPPLPLEFLEDSSSSARDIADANTRWALEFAKSFAATGMNVSVIYPDQAELEDAIRYVDMGDTTQPFPNVTMATIRTDSVRNAQSLDQIIFSILGATVAGTVE
eukprot:gene45059-60159_t